MSRTFKTVAVVLAIVAVLTLVVSGTIYAFRGDRCGSGDSSCAQQHRDGLHWLWPMRTVPATARGQSRCNAGSQP